MKYCCKFLEKLIYWICKIKYVCRNRCGEIIYFTCLKGKPVRFRRCPATVIGSDSKRPLFPVKGKWEGSKSDDHKPGDLPVLANINTYEDRGC